MRYLSRIPKTGFYKFQRGIPVELRHFFPGKGTTWREHLQTKDLPEARVKCLDVARRVEEAFQRARAKHQAEAENLVLPIPPVHELTVAVQFWREDQLYRRAEAVLSGYAEATVQFHRECRLTQAIERPSMAEAPADYLLRLEAEDAVLQGWIAEITLKEGWTLPEGHAARQVLWNMVRGAWLQVLQTEQKWRALDYSEMPVAPPPERRSNVAASAPSPTPLPTSSSLTLGEAYEAWAKAPVVHGARQREARTLIEGRLAVRRFKELHGDMALSAIQRTHARSYRDAISQLPAHLSKALNELPLPELLQRDLSAFQPRTATTINKSLNLLSAIASQAERNGHLDDTLGWKNPFDVQMEVNELYNESYEPFEKAELNNLFKSPVFSEGKRPKRGRGEASKWLPLLALLHGARRGELIQLRVKDIVTDPDTSIRYIRIAPDLSNQTRVKTVGSVRKTPLHPKIVELGFLKYLAARLAQVGPDGALWAGLDTRSRIKLWADWFHDYLANNSVDHPRKKFHSFRGTFKRFARDTLDAAIIDALCGHVSGVAGGYGKRRDSDGRDSGYSLAVLSEAIGKIDFNGVDFSPIG